MRKPIDYSNSRALITGASSGIGREFALQLHAKGAKVLLVARREEMLAEVAESLNAIRSGSAEYLPVDLTRRGENGPLAEVLESYLREHDIDILVNNAGFGSFGSFETLELDRELDMVALNISAHMALTHAVLRGMKERKSGGIITLSSIAGFQPIPYMATYGGTKAFNLFHSLGLRYELQEFGVRALAVCPGPVATEFGGVARVPGTWTGGSRDTAELVVKESIRAFEQDKAILVPCLRGKLMAFPGKFLPLSFSTWIVGRTLRKVLVESKKVSEGGQK